MGETQIDAPYMRHSLFIFLRSLSPRNEKNQHNVQTATDKHETQIIVMGFQTDPADNTTAAGT